MWGKRKTNPPQEGFTPLKDSGAAGAGGAASNQPVPPVAATTVAARAPSDRAAGPSLREIARKRLITDLFAPFASEPAGVILCVDTLTLRIISSCFRLSEISEHNVHLVEHITKRGPDGSFQRRQPLPQLPACYFITPSVDAVNQLLADYRDKKAPMYAACHLYFTSRLGEALLGKIKAAQAIRHVASFKELNIEFSLAESSVFMVDAPRALPLLFGGDANPQVTQRKQQARTRAAATRAKPPSRIRTERRRTDGRGPLLSQEHHRIANSLATLFVTLGDMPLIRHDANKPVAAAVANVLQAPSRGPPHPTPSSPPPQPRPLGEPTPQMPMSVALPGQARRARALGHRLPAAQPCRPRAAGAAARRSITRSTHAAAARVHVPGDGA